MSTIPKHEPELRRAKGQAYAARCNEIATNYDSKTIYQALELAEQAYVVHRLPYGSGLSNLKQFPPDRFEWICEEKGGAISIKLRDRRTGAIANWPHWAG
jgi:Fe2+ or Zn2+ uptake regulation protein